MFVIRQKQLDVFEHGGHRALQEKIAAHVRAFFPRQAAGMDDEALRAHVEEGMDRAVRRGIQLERDICLYVDLVVVFGAGFEEDAACPWARVLVDEASPSSAGERVHQAMAGALASLRTPGAAAEERPS